MQAAKHAGSLLLMEFSNHDIQPDRTAGCLPGKCCMPLGFSKGPHAPTPPSQHGLLQNDGVITGNVIKSTQKR